MSMVSLAPNDGDMMNPFIISFLIIVLSAAGCSKIDVRKYSENQPQLDLFEYFAGSTRGWGMVQGRDGEVKRQFVVDIVGTIDQPGTLVLEEDFSWADGEKTRRVWTIKKLGQNNFEGTADDVVGTATGSTSGNALNWNYTLNLSVDGSNWDIHFEDWMFLQPDGVLLNRAIMSKFAIRVGEVIISFKKPVQ